MYFDPQWLKELDQLSLERQRQLLQLPLVAEVRDKRVVDVARLGPFSYQIGLCLIYQFSGWLEILETRAPRRSFARHFWQRNIREEREHWQWWEVMTQAWGVSFSSEALRNPRAQMLPECQELYDWLDDLARRGDLAHALLAINYVVEWATAVLTQAVAPVLLPTLTHEQGQWIQAHAAGDEEHVRLAKRALAQLARSADRSQFSAVVGTTYEHLQRALGCAYPA